jgi:HSP20 family molecular chaperone IbpA
MSEQTLCTSENASCGVPKESQTGNTSLDRRRVFSPHVDLVDTPDAVVLFADLPGVDENSIDVTLEKNTLTIKATVPSPTFDGMKPVLREYAVGDFERSFTISDEISRDQIEATVTQGVLKLVLPKSKHAAMQQVQVKAG